jgi:hypothetical protein
VSSANSTPLSILAQAYANAAQLSETVENGQITILIQQRLQQQIAALPSTTTGDDALTQATQADVNRVTTQLNTINAYNNGNFAVLTLLCPQRTLMSPISRC